MTKAHLRLIAAALFTVAAAIGAVAFVLSERGGGDGGDQTPACTSGSIYACPGSGSIFRRPSGSIFRQPSGSIFR